jgi:hypothetical protein
MYCMGIRAHGYGNRKKSVLKNWIENKIDIDYYNSIIKHKYCDGNDFYLNDKKFQYYYVSYLYLIYNVCAHSYSSVGNFNSIVSIDKYNYIDFSLQPLFLDIL